MSVCRKLQTSDGTRQASQKRWLATVANADSVVDLNVAIALGTREMVRRHTVHAANSRVVPEKASEWRTRFESFCVGAVTVRSRESVFLVFWAWVAVAFAAVGDRTPDLVLVLGIVDRLFHSGAVFAIFRTIACIGDAFFLCVAVAFSGRRPAPLRGAIWTF